MGRDWESTFKSWSRSLSATEDEKCENAERMIRDAIRSDEKLASKDIQVFSQGSYRGNTNVRQNSDVDICVRCMSPFYTRYPPGKGDKDFNLIDVSYPFTDLKNDVMF